MYHEIPSENYDGYKALAAAVILRACEDYLHFRREQWEIECGAFATENYVKHIEVQLNLLRQFFLGGWLVCLSDGTDGQWLLEQLDQMFEEAAKTNDFSNIERITQLQIG